MPIPLAAPLCRLGREGAPSDSGTATLRSEGADTLRSIATELNRAALNLRVAACGIQRQWLT